MILRHLFTAADLFAILKTTEKLERAYVRDAISAKDYEPGCQKLIGQFKTLWESLRDEVSKPCYTWLSLWHDSTCTDMGEGPLRDGMLGQGFYCCSVLVPSSAPAAGPCAGQTPADTVPAAASNSRTKFR